MLISLHSQSLTSLTFKYLTSRILWKERNKNHSKKPETRENKMPRETRNLYFSDIHKRPSNKKFFWTTLTIIALIITQQGNNKTCLVFQLDFIFACFLKSFYFLFVVFLVIPVLKSRDILMITEALTYFLRWCWHFSLQTTSERMDKSQKIM